jgi:hypothetical protein
MSVLLSSRQVVDYSCFPRTLLLTLHLSDNQGLASRWTDMSYVIEAPEMMTSAATDLATIGSNLSAAHAAAAPTVAVAPAAADEVSAGIASALHGSQVGELLAMYQGVLDGADDLPLIPIVLRKHRGRLHYIPYLKWPVQYFVLRHVGRTLASLSRRYSARSALGLADDIEQQERQAVQEFQQSLPPDRHKIYIVLLIAAIVVFCRPIIELAVSPAIRVTNAGLGYLPFSEHQREQLLHQVLSTLDKIAALPVNITSVNDAVSAILAGGPFCLVVLTLGLTLSAYVVLRPFVLAFRLKRTLFNLAPEPEGPRRSAVVRWNVLQATGGYECEHRVFAALSARPPREFPIDLAVLALAMVLPLIYCGFLVWTGVFFLELRKNPSSLIALGVKADTPADARDDLDAFRLIGFGNFGTAISLLLCILVRLGWLCRTWRRRRLGRTGPYMPYEVRIRGGRAVANVENPIGWRLLLFLSILAVFLVQAAAFPTAIFIAFVIVGAFYALALYLLVSLRWWYRINRALRDLDRSYDSKHASSNPLGSLLVVALGWPILLPPFISVFRIVRHIQRAQARAAGPVTMWSPWILTPGLLFPPVLFAYLQRELNKVLVVEGEPLDPWPADTSREASRSTGTLPWLKAKGPNH